MEISEAGTLFKVMIVIGTRPEAIKMWPVVQAFSQEKHVQLHVCLTAQHRDMLDMFVQELGIPVHSDLNLMQAGQSLAELSGRLIPAMDTLMKDVQPDLVFVQGDTTTAALTALTAFYAGIQVGHIEAGLRSGDKWSPFPEEVNRKLVGVMADLHFAPTEQAKANLLAEGVAENSVWVTGNTVIDAVKQMAQASQQSLTPRILMTAHRRENFGQPILEILQGVRDVALRFPDVQIIYPVHPNPNVQKPANELLGGISNITLCAPLGYQAFVSEMQQSWFIVSDSGGVQEEATALGRPVLLLRNETERPEGLAEGNVRQVELSASEVTAAITLLLTDNKTRQAMGKVSNVFGDGKASERIVTASLAYLQKGKV